MARPQTVRPTMDASESTTGEEHDSVDERPSDWERLARGVAASQIDVRTRRVSDAGRNIELKLQDGEEVTGDDVQELRNAIVDLQLLIEGELTKVVDDTVSWEKTLYHVPYGVLGEAAGGRIALEDGEKET